MAVGQTRFFEWAKQSLTTVSGIAAESNPQDLTCLGRMIGDASIVALGEGDHLGAEPMLFRNRLLEYLVEEKGFTAIAIESGIVEGRVAHDYVRGGSGALTEVVAAGISWTFDELPQNAALIRWIREYNADPRHARKISFYGFDVPGSPSNPHAKRGVGTALVEVLKFLDGVDTEAARAFYARTERFLPDMHFDLCSPPQGSGYYKLKQSERDELTAVVADLIALLERQEARYTAASSAHDYIWAVRAAIGARQVDGWLRQIPLGWRASREQQRFLDIASDLRDRAQADNLDWIVRQEGDSGKVLIYAHNGHLSMSPVTWSWQPLNAAGELQQSSGAYPHEVAGIYLRRRFGRRLFTICNVIGHGSIGSGAFQPSFEPAAPSSLDAVARDIGVPSYLLDLRTAPQDVAHWLNLRRQLGRTVDLSPNYKFSLEVSPGQAFDAIFYLDTVSPASA